MMETNVSAAEGTEGPRRLDRVHGRSIFGKDVEGYARARLGYPPELFGQLLGASVPAPSCVFEIGAGTGLATQEILMRSAATVVAVEPDPRLASHLFGKLEPWAGRFRVRVEPFESNGLAGGRFDLGIAASSFHWLDPNSGLAEVRRLLRPGGRWAMWWNVYQAIGVGDALADEVAEMVRGMNLPPSEGVAGHFALDHERQVRFLECGGLEQVEYHLFRRERLIDAVGARQLFASFSYVRHLSESERERFLDRISELVETRFGGSVPNVVLTPFYSARTRTA